MQKTMVFQALSQRDFLMQLSTKESAQHEVEQSKCEKDVKKEEVLLMESSMSTGLKARYSMIILWSVWSHIHQQQRHQAKSMRALTEKRHGKPVWLELQTVSLQLQLFHLWLEKLCFGQKVYPSNHEMLHTFSHTFINAIMVWFLFNWVMINTYNIFL